MTCCCCNGRGEIFEDEYTVECEHCSGTGLERLEDRENENEEDVDNEY